MKSRLITITFLFFAIVLTLFFQKKEDGLVWVGDQKIRIELAQTQEELAGGLSGRKGLCSECGMLFILKRSDQHSFWMKGMSFNLDFIWIDGNRVVKINENVSYLKGEEEKIIPGVLADKVIELPAGKILEGGIKVGDKFSF